MLPCPTADKQAGPPTLFFLPQSGWCQHFHTVPEETQSLRVSSTARNGCRELCSEHIQNKYILHFTPDKITSWPSRKESYIHYVTHII